MDVLDMPHRQSNVQQRVRLSRLHRRQVHLKFATNSADGARELAACGRR
jgi:hypothetical protein